jgi:hypothetical protein
MIEEQNFISKKNKELLQKGYSNYYEMSQKILILKGMGISFS